MILEVSAVPVLLCSPSTCGGGRKSFLGRILQISCSRTRLRTKGVEHRLDVEATVCVLYQKGIFSPILIQIFQARVYFPFFLKELRMNIASSFTASSTASKSTLGICTSQEYRALTHSLSMRGSARQKNE